MAQYALVRDNVVALVLDITTPEEYALYAQSYQNVVDLTDGPAAEIGWVMEGNQLVPGPGQSAAASLKITRLAFRNRFTLAEKAALYTVAATGPGVALKVYIDDLAAASYVDLLRADTIANVNYLATLGLITAPRAEAILSTTLADEEKYHG